MRKLLLAATVAAAALSGAVPTQAAQIGIGVTIGSHPHYRHSDHYWWHGRWYDYRPSGYVYVAPPHPYADVYWRTHWRRYHHCHDYDRDGDCR